MNHELETDTQNIRCGVPQSSILEPLLFLLYVNDLPNSSALDPVMFADYTNLYFEQKDIKALLSLVDQEFQKINECLETNNDLTVEKQKTTFYINQVEIIIFFPSFFIT